MESHRLLETPTANPTATPTATPTHYEILGVKETATALEIKGAHRENALVLHPDKSNNPHSNEAAAAFRNIQLAWECLRDHHQRLQYDDSLKRIREKDHGALNNAKTVLLSDMNCEICDVEDDDDDTETIELKLYSVACRCGDIFEILEEELHAHNDNAATATGTDHEQLWDCRSCGLSIKVVNDS